jgi:hypothetical protein
MRLETYSSAESFLGDAGPDLEVAEAENSLILGVALRLQAEERARARTEPGPYLGSPPFLATLRDRGDWLLAALMTPPFPLILAGAPGCAPVAAATMARHLRGDGRAVPGVNASVALAQAFATDWETLSSQTRRDEVRQRIYRLERVADLPLRDGVLRHASSADEDLVGRWIAEFQAEADHDDDRERARLSAKSRIGLREIYLWKDPEDDEPRAMAGRSRPTRNTITVNAVYTPPELRRQGYATAAVARLSQALLAEGYPMCVLYTDLANPTSNSIYQRIGYERVADAVRYFFGERAESHG